jgi:hypothetical protein
MKWNLLDTADLQKLDPGYDAKGGDGSVTIASYPIPFKSPPKTIFMWGKIRVNLHPPYRVLPSYQDREI